MPRVTKYPPFSTSNNVGGVENGAAGFAEIGVVPGAAGGSGAPKV